MKKMKKINFKTSITAFVLFLFLITGLATSCKKSTCNYTPCTVRDSINISTGLADSSRIDPNWIVTSSPYPAGTPALTTPSYIPFWQPTPIAVTNAGWINCTGTVFTNSIGNYTFERSFTIAPGTISFSCDFGISYDDTLVSLDIISPTPTTTPLTHTASGYNVSPNIGTVFTSPTPGVWKIRATVTFIDNVGGFLTSGYIKVLRPC